MLRTNTNIYHRFYGIISTSLWVVLLKLHFCTHIQYRFSNWNRKHLLFIPSYDSLINRYSWEANRQQWRLAALLRENLYLDRSRAIATSEDATSILIVVRALTTLWNTDSALWIPTDDGLTHILISVSYTWNMLIILKKSVEPMSKDTNYI